MDPASVVGLVAACGSLVKTCAGVIKTLHDVVELYKDAELSILSMIDECENIRFAWASLEGWVNDHLRGMDNYELLLERFQRSIYVGQLSLSALEKDLAKSSAKPSAFRRRANMVWNVTIFQEHQNRIRGHNAALQLLLQVISMPRNGDRVDLLSVKEHVFRQADESVLSIIPSCLSSRLSSRLSFAGTDTSSIKTNMGLKLQYVRFDFEDDLFTSFVYKRNYRLPFMDRLSVSSVRRRSWKRNSFRTPTSTIEEQSEVDAPPPYQQPAWFQPFLIPLREGVNTVKGQHMESPMVAQAIQLLQSLRYAEALSLLRDGADVIFFFQPHCAVDPAVLFAFLWFVWEKDQAFFAMLLERIAYSAGESWVRGFQNAFLSRSTPDIELPDSVWSKAGAAGAFFDRRPSFDNPLSSPTALQLACASGNCLVAEYLLRVGFRPEPGEEYKHPIIFARLSADAPMEELLSDWLDIPPDIVVVALLSLYSCQEDFIYWCDNRNQTRVTLDAAMTMFLPHVSPSTTAHYLGKRTPLLHAVVYSLHCNRKVDLALLKLLCRLINSGTDLDEVGEVPWGQYRMSPLALAAALGEVAIFMILLKNGAKVFVWEGDDTLPSVNPAGSPAGEKVIDCLTAWCYPSPGFSFNATERHSPGRDRLKHIQILAIPSTKWVDSQFLALRQRFQGSLHLHKANLQKENQAIGGHG